MIVVVPPYIDLLGLPFERGSRGPLSFDCYGLAIEMFRRDGIAVPDFASPGTVEEVATLVVQNQHRWRRVAAGTLKSLVTFRVEGAVAHVGYMVAADRFIHAFEHTGVTTERLTNGSFKPQGFYTYG